MNTSGDSISADINKKLKQDSLRRKSTANADLEEKI